MNIGILKIHLRLPENLNLKGKRHVVKSIISRIQNKFNVSVAETDDNDLWQLATIGIACVSNDGRFTNQELSKIVDFVRECRLEAELLDYETEILDV